MHALYACDDALRGFGYEANYERSGDALFRAAQQRCDPACRTVAVRFGECMYKRLLGSLLHELLHAFFGEQDAPNYGVPWGLPYGVPDAVAPADEAAFLARFNESEARAFSGVWLVGKALFGIEWNLRTARDVGTYGFTGGNAMVAVPRGFRPVAHLDRQHHTERYYARARAIEQQALAWFAEPGSLASVVATLREREAAGREGRTEKRPPAGDFGRMAPRKTFMHDACICGGTSPYGQCCARLSAGASAPISGLAR